MSTIIIHSGDEVLDDVFTPELGADNEPDSGRRRMIVRAANTTAALALLDPAVEPVSGLFCVKRKPTPRRCGFFYNLDAEYKGLASEKPPVLVINDSIEGWDTARETRLILGTEEESRAARDIGSTPSGHDHLFCVSRQPTPIVNGRCYQVEFSFKGLAGDKPVKWIPKGYSEHQHTQNGSYSYTDGLGAHAYSGVPLDSNQGLVGITKVWISTTIPDMSVMGTQITPDYTPGVPDNFWVWLTNPTHVFPFRWVLETREFDIIPGTTTCIVTDNFVFYQHLKPSA